MSANEMNPQQEPVSNEEIEQEILAELEATEPETEETEEPEKAPETPDVKAAREEKRRKEEKRSNILYAAIAIAFIAVAAVTMIWKSGVVQRGADAAVVNGETYSAAQVQYYYSNIYQNFINSNYYYLSYMGLDTTKSMKEQTCTMDDSGITWFDYFADQALQQMSHIHAIADKAEAEGFTWNDEMQAAFDDAMAQLEANTLSYNQAQGTDLTVKDYIHELCGELVSQDVYEEQLKLAIQAQFYANSYVETLDYSEDQLEALYAESPETYDRADYESVRISGAAPASTDADGNAVEATEEEQAQAKENAKALADSIYASFLAGEEMSSLADGEKAIYYDGTRSSYYDAAVTNWVFDSARQPGDSTVLFDESSTTYYVISFKDRYRDDYNTINVRHILIQPEAGEKTAGDEGYEAEQAQLKADAKARANGLLAQWRSGEATEDSFAQLANENSTDGGSNTNGGLYTQVYQGEMVPAFNDWCFDESRETGDTDVVETDYGYHIMYFVGKDMPYWQIQATSVLMNEDCTNWYTEATKDAAYEIKDGGMKYVG